MTNTTKHDSTILLPRVDLHVIPLLTELPENEFCGTGVTITIDRITRKSLRDMVKDYDERGRLIE